METNQKNLEFLSQNQRRKESTLEEGNTRGISKRWVTWEFLKGAIFLICLSLFTFQSLKFYFRYTSHPIRTNMVITSPKRFKLPAITICNRSAFPRSQFCSEHPDVCQKPNNLEEFCEMNPILCRGNVTNLKIPKLGYYADNSSSHYLELIQESYKNTSQHMSFFIIESSLDSYIRAGKRKIHFIRKTGVLKSVLVDDFANEPTGTKAKCYSANLHLTSNEESETLEIHSSDGHDGLIFAFKLVVKPEDVLTPWIENQALFSIHSPFVPVNPLNQPNSLHPGYQYNVYVKLTEEHLLPHPYKTDCTDYEDLWKKNNKTGPRSQEMCKEWCSISYYRHCRGCNWETTMIENSEDSCLFGYPVISHDDICVDENRRKRLIGECEKNCKVSCRKVNYHANVVKRAMKPSLLRKSNGSIGLSVFVKDTEVVIIGHAPLFGIFDIFSYVGGLIGCWLGISVWTLVGILERSIQRIVQYIQKK